MRTEFSVNPKSLKYIAEKPTQCNPFTPTEDLIKNFPLLNTKDEKTQEITKQLRSTVANIELDPREKHKRPQSTSMEIGWFHGIPKFEITQAEIDTSIETNTNTFNKDNTSSTDVDDDDDEEESQSLAVHTKKRWHYPLGQSSITKFAQHYTLTMGHNPFKRKAQSNQK